MDVVRRRRKRRPGLRPARSWTIRYALSAYLIVLAVGLALVLALTHTELRLGVGVLAIDTVMLLTLIPLRRGRRFSAADLGLRTTAPGHAVGLVIAATFTVAAINVLWIQRLMSQPHGTSLGVRFHEGTAAKILTGFALAVSAPVVEEIFFRGVLYRALRSRLSVAWAALIGGFLFGAIHGTTYPLDTLPPRMAFGVVACLLYEYTGSLYPGMALHVLIDGSAFEVMITGHSRIVFPAFILLGLGLLLYAAVRQHRARRRETVTPAAPGDTSPGWRPNPSGTGFRYWDGERWTDSYAGARLGGALGAWLRRPAGAALFSGLWLEVAVSTSRSGAGRVNALIVLNLIAAILVARDNRFWGRRLFSGATFPVLLVGPIAYFPWARWRVRQRTGAIKAGSEGSDVSPWLAGAKA